VEGAARSRGRPTWKWFCSWKKFTICVDLSRRLPVW